MANPTPRVWIADLAAYNAGFLHGKWVDATDLDAMTEAGERLIKTSPVWAMGMNAEELAIHDYDEFPGAVVSDLGEYPNWETVVRIANGLEDHGPAFGAWLGTLDSLDEYENLDERFQECNRGFWDTEEAYAEEYIAEVGWAGVAPIPDELLSYLDMEKIARELFQHGPYTYVNGYVFEDVG